MIDARGAGARERRPAVWPYLVMPLIVLVVFYGLHRVHGQARTPVAEGPPPPAAGAPGGN